MPPLWHPSAQQRPRRWQRLGRWPVAGRFRLWLAARHAPRRLDVPILRRPSVREEQPMPPLRRPQAWHDLRPSRWWREQPDEHAGRLELPEVRRSSVRAEHCVPRVLGAQTRGGPLRRPRPLALSSPLVAVRPSWLPSVGLSRQRGRAVSPRDRRFAPEFWAARHAGTASAGFALHAAYPCTCTCACARVTAADVRHGGSL